MSSKQIAIKDIAFLLVWLGTVVLLLVLLPRGAPEFASWPMLLAVGSLLICTLLLGWQLRSPIQNTEKEKASTGALSLMALISLFLLVLARELLGPSILYALPVIAGLVLLWLRRPSQPRLQARLQPLVTRREIAYAGGLALLAGAAGLGAGWIKTFPLPAWAALQVALVLGGLLAGWAMLRHFCLDEQGIGASRFLRQGWLSALRGFGLGLLLSLPWAQLNVLLDSGSSCAWVHAWWQPLIAIQPGIAEEAWGRMLLVPLLFAFFRRSAAPRQAFSLAIVVAGYWFAYLHTPGLSGGMSAIIGTLLTGTLYSLPIAWLCFYRDLETAIGFHFFIDFVKFGAALVLF